jgi:hypothetical protein
MGTKRTDFYPELDKSDLARRFSVTRVTIYRWLDAGKFTQAQLDWIVAEQGKAKQAKRTGTAVVKRTVTFPSAANDTGTPLSVDDTDDTGVTGAFSQWPNDTGDTGTVLSANDTGDTGTPRKRPLYHLTKVDAFVLLPIAIVNVAPRLVPLFSGHAEPISLAFLLLQLLFLFIMSRTLSAVVGWGGNNIFAKAFLGIVVAPVIASPLIATNLTFSTESVGMIWDAMAARNQSTIDAHKRLQGALNTAQEQLAQAQATAEADRTRLTNDLTFTTAQLNNLLPYHPTTDAQIASAQNSYDAMKRVQDPDCVVIIGNSTACRKFLNQLNTLSTTLNTLRSDRATELKADGFRAHINELNTQIDAIEPTLKRTQDEFTTKIAGLNAELTKIGPVPKFADTNAHRLAGDLGTTDDQIEQKLPLFISLVIELVAFVGPYILAG